MKSFLRFLLLGVLVCTSCIANSDKPNTMGDVYILTSHNGPRKLFKVRSDCFIFEVECPTPEITPNFPEGFTRYNWADMYWSPNGKFMLSIDHRINESKESKTEYLAELILYNAQNGKLEKLISGYKYISGITWNPSSEWAAMAIKKPDDEDMQTVLINPKGEQRILPIQPASEAGYSPDIFNGQVFDNNQYPIQWLNENELIFSRTRGEPTTSPNDFLVLPVRHYFKFNIQTNEEVEMDLPTQAYYQFSPNGSLAHFEEDQVEKIYSFESEKILELKDFGLGTSTTNWSPDSKYLVACQKGLSTYVITPDLKNQQEIMKGCSFYPVWMPDSDHLILFFFSYENNGKIIESHWYVASISEGNVREIIIPGLDLKGKNVNGIYVQPVKLSE